MKRAELIASVDTLMYAFSKFEFVCSLLVMFGVSLFFFFFLSDSVAGEQTSSFATAGVWHQGGEWIRSLIGNAQMRGCSRCLGCACAGFVAAVFFGVIRHLLLCVIGNMRLIEYYRFHLRLLFWTMCVVLSFSLSQFFVKLFVPVSQVTANVVLACLVVWLTIFSLRVKRSVFLCAAYVMLGVLSAASIAGVVMLIVTTILLFLAKVSAVKNSVSKRASAYGYGAYVSEFGSYGAYPYAYGAYGSSTSTDSLLEKKEFDLTTDALLAERLRLLLLLCFITGFVVTLALIFGYGVSAGVGVRKIVLLWLSWFGTELKGVLAASELMTLACCVTISVLFVCYRLERMFDAEYYLKVRDVFRLGVGFLLACVTLICIGRRIPIVTDARLAEVPVFPLVIQVFASCAILVVATIFLVNLKCRKFSSATANEDYTKAVRQYNRMRVVLLLSIDLLPVILLAVAIAYSWLIRR